MMDIMNCSEAFMYYYNPREGTRAEKMDNQIDERTKTARLERLINEQLERQKVIRENTLPIKRREAIITSLSRDDKERYLARDEHNYYYSFSPIKNHNIGDRVFIDANELSGNTFRGVEIE